MKHANVLSCRLHAFCQSIMQADNATDSQNLGRKSESSFYTFLAQGF